MKFADDLRNLVENVRRVHGHELVDRVFMEFIFMPDMHAPTILPGPPSSVGHCAECKEPVPKTARLEPLAEYRGQRRCDKCWEELGTDEFLTEVTLEDQCDFTFEQECSRRDLQLALLLAYREMKQLAEEESGMAR